MFTSIITLAGKLPSVNNMYFCTKGGGKYLNPEVNNIKQHIRINLIKQGCKEYFKDFSKIETLLELEIFFVLKDSFFKRDTTNIIKAVEDAVAEAIGIDDRYNMKIQVRKVLNDIDNFEHIILVIKDYNKSDYKYLWSDLIK